MVKFFNYLNESILKEDMTMDEINEMIHKDCKYYLNLIKNEWLFSRGLQSHSDIFGIKNVRQNRIPRGTPGKVFNILNDWLQNNGHIRRDKAIMAISSKDKASIYNNMFGPLYYIFPIGNFNYTWIKALDLNMEDTTTGWYMDTIAEFFKNEVDNTRKGFKTYFTTNKGIETAWKNEYEIWFDCKKYYYFSHKTFEYTLKNNKLILIQKMR